MILRFQFLVRIQVKEVHSPEVLSPSVDGPDSGLPATLAKQ